MARITMTKKEALRFLPYPYNELVKFETGGITYLDDSPREMGLGMFHTSEEAEAFIHDLFDGEADSGISDQQQYTAKRNTALSLLMRVTDMCFDWGESHIRVAHALGSYGQSMWRNLHYHCEAYASPRISFNKGKFLQDLPLPNSEWMDKIEPRIPNSIVEEVLLEF